MYRRILVVLDTHPASRNAVIEAVQQALLAKASLHFFHIMPSYVPPMPDSPAGAAWRLKDHLEEVRRSGAKLIKAALRDAEVAGVNSTADAVFADDAAERIVQEARRKNCDLIVTGSRGRSTLQRLLFGSVVTKLITISHVPLLICKKSGTARPRAGTVAVSRATVKREVPTIKPAKPILTRTPSARASRREAAS